MRTPTSLFLTAFGILVGGCAKFPTNGDAKSNFSFNDPQTRIIQNTTTTYTDQGTPDDEQAGDTGNGTLASVDIVEWTLQVTQP